MAEVTKKESFWQKRKGTIPFLVIATVVIAVLFLNEETSVRTNMEYEGRINDLRQEIRHNRDSALYYRQHRLAIENGESDLERLARERYHMQKPTEDVFVYGDR
ncbi:MAG: hypothetical protein J1F07_06845 [Muribaculaceae bacterium]|nr:hypothetical protein [Muribaculaceae bacterium]